MKNGQYYHLFLSEGIREATDICLPAFLSSVNSVINLVTLILPSISDETMVVNYNIG